jgi:hypothetical protein
MNNTNYTINPNTGRPVKIGGRIWTKLIKDGLIESDNIQDDNVLYEVEEGDDLEELCSDFNTKMKPNIQAVRGRGRYKNKIVKRKKNLTHKQMKEYTTNTAIQAVKENMGELAGYDSDELEQELQRIIDVEMMTGNTLKKVKQRKNNKQLKQKARFVEVSESEEESEEETEYESEESVEYESEGY